MKRLAVVALVLLLAACAASGVQVKEEQLAQFKQGQTTVQEVIKALGNPTQSVLMPDGGRMLVYSYAQVQTRPETFIPIVGAFVGGADTKSNSAMLMFDRNGVLKTMSASSGAIGTGAGVASGTGLPQRVPDQPKQAE